MANPEHLAILQDGVQAWNKWKKVSYAQPDLSGADLWRTLGCGNFSGIDFSYTNLSGAQIGSRLPNDCFGELELLPGDYACLDDANLSHADLSGASIRLAVCNRASFYQTDLTNANFEHSDLGGALLAEAKCTSAIMRWCRFDYARLRDMELAQTILEGSSFHETLISNVDLSHSLGLEHCRHNGPSVVDVRTLLRSKRIPRSFLVGCGFPDAFIDFWSSAVKQPVQEHSCFISYSTKDKIFADKLHDDLQANGIRCWRAPESLRGGRNLYEQIRDAIHHHDRLLLILSKHSIASEWVRTEISSALELGRREGRQILFPIGLVPFERIRRWQCFDADTGIDYAKAIRRMFIPDFSTWEDDDCYERALRRLVQDLKEVGPRESS